MDEEIITIYCICDELLTLVNHHDNTQCHVSSAEIMTVALVSSLYFGGNFALAIRWLHTPHWMPRMLSRSRFSRRLHRLSHHFMTLFELLAVHWQEENKDKIYNVDSFPIPVCDNIRIKRCRIYSEERYRGYKASKRRYFYGLKLHLVTTEAGQPVEFLLSPASVGDVSGLRGLDFDLPEGATIIGDKAYNLYWLEDLLREIGLKLLPVRKKNSKRPHEPWERGLQYLCRQSVETAGSLLNGKLPNSIHAVSAKSFELKVQLFVVALSLHHVLR